MPWILTVDSWEPYPPQNPATPRRYVRGDIIDDHDLTDLGWLENNHIAINSDAATQPAHTVEATVNAADTTEVEEAATTADATEDETLQQPRKAAHIDEWRKYAEAKGIDTKGLSKAEIIAAATQ